MKKVVKSNALVIDATTVTPELAEKLTDLCVKAREFHKQQAAAANGLSSTNDQIASLCFEDQMHRIASDNPEVYQNYDIQTPTGITRVTYKYTAGPCKESNDTAPDVVFKEAFGEEYPKLFNETPEYTVLAEQPTLQAQAASHPELFNVRLKDISTENMIELIKAHPGWFEVSVVDVSGYAKAFPDTTKTTTGVKPKAGFMENLGKLDKDLLKNLKDFLDAFLRKTITPAVVHGNTSKKD